MTKVSGWIIPSVAFGLALSGFALGFSIGQIIWGEKT